ncbi:hypothetical protein H8356DRAFT_1358472 [Neocallimastix lanati (nom. inval.)]|nr:hypothetical protein H8356DRAFT_1358472 [Neocallimastix sp. JGI-2020a]
MEYANCNYDSYFINNIIYEYSFGYIFACGFDTVVYIIYVIEEVKKYLNHNDVLENIA